MIKITERKKEIIVLLSEGYNVPKIAEKLILSKATVRTHIQQMFYELGLNNQSELVAWGFRNGILR